MSRKFLVPIDLTKQELQNATIQNLASAPASPVSGQIYFNTSDNTLYFYDGTAWVAAKTNPYSYAATGETTDISITATESNGISLNLARADHQHAGPGFASPSSLSFGGATAEGVATTVSRSDHSHQMPAHDAAAHSLIKISDLAAPSSSVSFGSQKITSLADPTNAQEAATKNYVDTKPLNTFAGPTGDLSLSSKKITSLADPSSAQDAATKNYVDTRKVTDLTAPTTAFSMNSQKITNLATPTADSDAANKGYVDNAVAGLSWKDSVHLLAASNISTAGVSGTLIIDSHPALSLAEDGYRLLLKGQTTTSENGIYVYQDDGALYTLVRATDADNYTELVGAAVFVKEGTLYEATAWVQSEHYLTSFAGQVWTQFSGQGTYIAGNGLELTGNSFSLKPVASGGLDASSSGASIKLATTSGLETTSNGLAVKAGTGISLAGNSVAIDTTLVTRKYSETLTGALSNNVYVTHNFGTKDVTVQVYTVADGSQVEVDITRTTNDSVILGFAVAPTSGVYRAVVIG